MKNLNYLNIPNLFENENFEGSSMSKKTFNKKLYYEH